MARSGIRDDFRDFAFICAMDTGLAYAPERSFCVYLKFVAIHKTTKANKSVVATAGNVFRSLRSGRLMAAVPHF